MISEIFIKTIHIIACNKTWDESSSSIKVFQSFLDVNNIYIIPKDDIPNKQGNNRPLYIYVGGKQEGGDA